MYRTITRESAVAVATLEDFMADHPDATMQDIWDAAFMAGHQTAYTLLTGEST